MVLYEVTWQVEPQLAAAVEEYNRFRTTYQADGQADLDRYLREYAPRFRAEFQTRFPEGVILTRETWVQREVWSE